MTPAPPRRALTRQQRAALWAAWGGWTLDGMDSFIYALVLAPAMRELLPRSGIAVTPGNVGFYGSLLFALFLVGWGLSLGWGPVADRFGRVRTLQLTILCYSLFTCLGAFTSSIWSLALCRTAAGIGIGGEWSIGSTVVAETLPEGRRAAGAGLMHTGYYVGFFIAAVLNYTVGAQYGWRAMFLVGGVPALLVLWIRHSVGEPERWVLAAAPSSIGSAVAALFADRYRRRTVVNALLLFISIVGLWAGSVYVPAAVAEIAARGGIAGSAAARLASRATMILSAGTILGCVALPLAADRFGRRMTLAGFFVVMAASIALAFGYVFYLESHALAWFMVALFFLGLGGANFAVYTLWLPEQYETACRASAFAFATSVGRFGGAAATFLVGAGVARYHTIGTPVAFTALAFIAGLLVIPFAEETRALPS